MCHPGKAAFPAQRRHEEIPRVLLWGEGGRVGIRHTDGGEDPPLHWIAVLLFLGRNCSLQGPYSLFCILLRQVSENIEYQVV